MGNRCFAFSFRGIHEKQKSEKQRCVGWAGKGGEDARAMRGAICFPEGEKEGRHFEGISILSRIGRGKMHYGICITPYSTVYIAIQYMDLPL